ncbi:MAG: hypothetical protein LBU04_06060 [Christensenellaceae bacterium]|jgi:4-diphosphocytidyl-2-C-methyl-D-erythritol kinase|nr:hypothetical protein [Christensenellaceae bacterium]
MSISVAQPRISTQVFAKINLCFNIEGRLHDGYHAIDSILINIPVYDEITLSPRNDKIINISYSDARIYEDDSAKRAALLLDKKFHLNGADISIKKNIPECSGLGGSSADAAGVIRCYSQMHNINISNTTLVEIGSDVPYMYRGGTCRIQGKGEFVEAVTIPSIYGVVVINDKIRISTKDAYALFDRYGGHHGDVDKFILDAKHPFNALEDVAKRLDPRIKMLSKLLCESGFEYVVMTGSGGGVVGYSFDHEVTSNAFLELLRRIDDTKKEVKVIRF